MRTYVYCLLPASAEAPPAGLAGIAGAPVRALACGQLTAWVSDAPAPDETPDVPAALAARARAHDAVPQAALDAGATPLPARYGQTYADDAACARSLASNGDALLLALARVEHLVEMAAIVPLDDDAAASERADVPASPGRAYLEEARRRLAPEMLFRNSGVRRRITETLGDLVRDEAVAVVRSPSVPPSAPYARVAHLLPRVHVAEYRDRVARLSAELSAPDASRAIRVLGPYAPYSFAHVNLSRDE